MFGSSTIRKFDADRLLTCGKWENRGIGTAGIPNIQNYLALPLKRWSPEWIIVYAGDNDVARDGRGSVNTIALYDELIRTLSSRFPESSLLLLEIKPSPKRVIHHTTYNTINAHLREFANQSEKAVYVASNWENITHIQGLDVFQDDGVHLNESGNQIMAKRINEACNNQ